MYVTITASKSLSGGQAERVHSFLADFLPPLNTGRSADPCSDGRRLIALGRERVDDHRAHGAGDCPSLLHLSRYSARSGAIACRRVRSSE
jgi:hypothetical protein